MSGSTRTPFILVVLSGMLALIAACAGAKLTNQQGRTPPVQSQQEGADGAVTSIAPAMGNAVSVPPISLQPLRKETEVPMIKLQAGSKIDKSGFQRAPSITSPTWINSAPLTLNDLQGKVVVVEFWTFACYNCKNTLPYVKAWYEKYRDQGLVVIGVHTPELSYERDVSNVKQAVSDYGIKYTVAIDGDFGNWNRFHVWAWPTWFIIDKEGYIRYNHVGEGDYSGSEAMIRQLLGE